MHELSQPIFREKYSMLLSAELLPSKPSIKMNGYTSKEDHSDQKIFVSLFDRYYSQMKAFTTSIKGLQTLHNTPSVQGNKTCKDGMFDV